VQQSLQLEGLYREIVRALAELGARNNDEQVRGLLQQHGISYTVNPPAAAAPAAPAAARK
jgi:D-alanine-D-alanine ligase-like ATP-grasp enzyme